MQRDLDGILRNVEINTWDSVTVAGIESDSTLYNNQKGLSELYLYLRSDTTITQYSIRWHEMTDTLTIFHTNLYNFISMACGCVVDHELIDVAYTRNFIDTVSISNRNVSLIEMKHIVLHPQNND